MLAGMLRFANRVRRMRLGWIAILAIVTTLAWLVSRPLAGKALVFLADRSVFGFLAAAVHAATSVARLKPRLLADGERSWLAALPARLPIASRIAFGFVVQLLAIAVLFASIAAVSTVAWSAARGAWLGVLGGYVAGGLFGWFPDLIFPGRSNGSAGSQDSAGSRGAMGSQYAIVRKVRERWAVAPGLSPLGYWAVARARALANPGVTARTLVIVLLGVPMGTPGEVALAAAAGWMAGLYMLMNLVATVRTAHAAGWWLAPTPIRFVRFAATLVSRALFIQVGVAGAAIIAVAAVERPLLISMACAAAVAWLLFFVGASTLACATAMRPTGNSRWWLR